jgi:uncharacterized protein YndB with AHSA1/START domain
MAIIEETVHIDAPPGAVWSLLTDPASWPQWCSVIADAEGPATGVRKGSPIRFTLYIMGVRFTVEPTIEVVQKNTRLVWSGTKFGVRSRHEFRFSSTSGKTRLESFERLWGIPTLIPGFPLSHLKKLTHIMLTELKQAAEVGSGVS